PRVWREVVWHPADGLPIYRNLPPELFAQLRASLPKKRELVRRLWAAGAEVYIGTDCLQPFVVPGAALHEEMKLFAAAGIPPEAIWAMGTWRAGRGLRQRQLGRLEPGAPADLLVFREDPTRDLAALDTLVAVVSQGRVFPRDRLQRDLAAWGEHMKEATFDQLSVNVARPLMDQVVLRDY
ncbi:MAG TPA: amidohydrolase family protein, partial [Thermoanaerobaculia bacterium]|nr:amidohydrolase family protein [Thermoanaerobaculia bacterium]